jgi:hypothetical protein
MNRRIFAVVASVAVITAVISILLISRIPFPDFLTLQPGAFSTSIAFVARDNCVKLADLGRATVTELRCEPEQAWIDQIEWNDSGIEITAHLNQPITRVLNPNTGELIETRTGAEVIAPPPPTQEHLVVTRPDSDRIVVYDEQGRELLVLNGPERYWIEAAIPNPDGKLIVIADSQGRLAVLDRSERVPYLVDEDVLSWPYPVWEP